MHNNQKSRLDTFLSSLIEAENELKHYVNLEEKYEGGSGLKFSRETNHYLKIIESLNRKINQERLKTWTWN